MRRDVLRRDVMQYDDTSHEPITPSLLLSRNSTFCLVLQLRGLGHMCWRQHCHSWHACTCSMQGSGGATRPGIVRLCDPQYARTMLLLFLLLCEMQNRGTSLLSTGTGKCRGLGSTLGAQHALQTIVAAFIHLCCIGAHRINHVALQNCIPASAFAYLCLSLSFGSMSTALRCRVNDLCLQSLVQKNQPCSPVYIHSDMFIRMLKLHCTHFSLLSAGGSCTLSTTLNFY